MKNNFFGLIVEEMKNNKNLKKLEVLKIALLLYITSLSKVVYEEQENLRDDGYLLLEYLNNAGFEYNFEGTYMDNIKKLSEKIKIFEEMYGLIENLSDMEKIIENLKRSEMDLKLDILRGSYVKVARNFIGGVINFPVIRDKSLNELSLELLNICNNEILYSVDFFENSNFYGEKISQNEKNAIIEILTATANLKHMETSSIILTKDTNSVKQVFEFIKNSKKGLVEKEAFYMLTYSEREEIIKTGKIEGVISMPFNNVLKNQVIILNEEKTDKEEILFIRSKKFFEKANEKIKTENLKALLDVFRKKENINGISSVVSNDTILKRGSSLDILNYVFKTKEKVDLNELKQKKCHIYDLMLENSQKCDKLMEKYLEKVIQ